MHGLLHGGVATADLKEAALQCVLADDHGEKNSHLVIPYVERPRRCSTSVREMLLRSVGNQSLRRMELYFAVSCSIEVGCVLRYPGHTEIMASNSSRASPSHTYSNKVNVYFLWKIGI